jgi:hypothetical protein
MTMTTAPLLNSSSQLLNLNFDGTFFDVEEKTNHVGENTDFAVRVPGLNSNQIWIHETMLESLFYSLQEKMPIKIKDKNMTSQLLNIFYEITDHYGKNLSVEL